MDAERTNEEAIFTRAAEIESPASHCLHRSSAVVGTNSHVTILRIRLTLLSSSD